MISVVITAWHDYASWPLSDAVRSLLAQDVGAEIIVVDNASAPPIAPLDGCRVIRLPERRILGEARNAGLDAVTTPYMVFWDADDVMLPGTLRALRDALEAAGDGTVACTCAIVEGGSGRRSHWPRRWVPALARRPRLFALVNALWSQYPVTSSLVRTDAVRSCGGFPASDQGEDWALGNALAFRGRILMLDHPGLWYRNTSDSLSSGWRSFPDVWRNSVFVRARLRADRGIPRWVRASTPVLASLQLLILAFVRPPARLARRLRTPARPGPHESSGMLTGCERSK